MKKLEIQKRGVKGQYFPNAQAYQLGACKILVAIEGGRYHLSISHPNRLPTWDELKQVRYELCPHELTMAMILPPPSEFVNIHEYCFHLWEVEGDKKA